MKPEPDSELRIVDEVISVPFTAGECDMFVSAFKVRCAAEHIQCLSLHVGDFSKSERPALVRIHSGCITGEVFHDAQCDCAWQLEHALELICKASLGVLIYLPNQEGRGNGLLEKIKSFRLVSGGLTTAEAFNALGIPLDTRDYSAALTVLRRLGVRRMRLITNNPAKLEAARHFGFEVISRIPSVLNTSDSRILEYLQHKKRDFGHLI